MGTSEAASLVLNSTACAVADDSCPNEVLELFDAYGASLFRFARLMLRSHADAEDVVQSTFVRLIDHLAAHRLNRGESGSNLRAWLFTVAANLCRDQLRMRKRWSVWLPEHEQRLTAAPDVEARDAMTLFLTAIATLAPRDRALVALKAQGLSYRDIAAATGVRETSVGRLLARAMARWHQARTAMSHT